MEDITMLYQLQILCCIGRCVRIMRGVWAYLMWPV